MINELKSELRKFATEEHRVREEKYFTKKMSRTMLRYAIEKVEKERR